MHLKAGLIGGELIVAELDRIGVIGAATLSNTVLHRVTHDF